MTKTEHYNLPQWEKTDRVLMEDFNEAMTDIDEAMAELKTAIAYVKIKEMITTNASSMLNFDVSDIDFMQYLKIELFIQSPTYHEGLSILVNNLTSGYKAVQLSGSGGGMEIEGGQLASFSEFSRGVLLFYYPHPLGKVGCVSISSSGTSSYTGYQYITSCTWSQLQSFNFQPWKGSLPAGTKITLCGIKA